MKHPPAPLPRVVRAALISHARREAPLECCGFLVGARGRVRFAMAMQNVDPRPRSRYRIDDRQHIQIRRWLRRLSPPLEIVGVYHSHPNGDARPSATDRAEALYPDWLFAIVSLAGRHEDVAVFRITKGRARRLGR
jgi:proteasome lid subunit RPN8/RPN11